MKENQENLKRMLKDHLMKSLDGNSTSICKLPRIDVTLKRQPRECQVYKNTVSSEKLP